MDTGDAMPVPTVMSGEGEREMGRGIFRFQPVTEEGPPPRARLALGEEREGHPFEVPHGTQELVELKRQEPPMEDRDEAIFLLHTAAEIEHALLVQYLYAAYSLDLEQSLQRSWRDIIMEIAREEMAHLITVQNILRALGGPLNFEREDYPFNQFYPFSFRLEPFSLHSVAKYVLAEMPHLEAIPPYLGFDYAQVKKDANIESSGGMINRVGALYALLVKIVGQLRPEDFRGDTLDYQATREEWSAWGEMIVEQVHDPLEAIHKALIPIAQQGEGAEEPSTVRLSHFRRFFTLYEQVKAHPGIISRRLPHNPTTQSLEAPGYISDKAAQAWAVLFDTRYRILLTHIAHALSLSRSTQVKQKARAKLVGWALSEMFNLTQIVEFLTVRPQHDPPRQEEEQLCVAGPPFRLPYTLNLPDRWIDRWRLHQVLIGEARDRIDQVQAGLPSPEPFLETLSASDTENLKFIELQMAQSSVGTAGTDTNGTTSNGTNGSETDMSSERDLEGFERVGAMADFPVGSIRKITVHGEDRVLYHVDPSTSGVDSSCSLYASQLYCWHRPTLCELSGTGVLQGKVVTCQTKYRTECAHGSKYDVVTGERLNGPAPANKPLVIYTTRCVHDEVWVAVAPFGGQSAS